MTHRTALWTYRAGARVLTVDGSPLGTVAAVRRNEVLVADQGGESRWIAGSSVRRYDGETLTVACGALHSRPFAAGRPSPSDHLLAKHTHWGDGSVGFDA